MSEQPELHVLLTTIGTGSYKRARYEFAGESEPRVGELFPALLCDHLSARGTPVQKAVVLLTSEAREHKNWRGDENDAQARGLKRHLEERGIEIIEADIRNGNNEEELWEIFKAVGEKIPKGAAVTLDITHGFRSLPLVMLLACAYHNASGDSFKLKGVYYGAFVKENEPAQAVDMTPMLTLFEWASAVDAFKRSGSLRQMAELLTERQKELYRGQVVDRRARLPLRPIADQMSLLTEAIELGRVESFAEPVEKIRALSDEVRTSAERWAQPFTAQIDKVLAQLDRFQLSVDEEDVNRWLAAQFRLIEWYSENGFYVHASLLLREWVISYVISQTPEHRGKKVREIYEDDDLREEVARALNSATKDREAIGEISKLATELAKKINALSPAFRSIVGLPSFELRMDATAAVSGVWDELKELRNDVAHMGHRKQPFTVENVKKKVKELIKALRPLVPVVTPSAPSGEPAAPAE